MRWKLTTLIAAACVTAVACSSDTPDDSTSDLIGMDTTATGVSTAPAAEVGTSPDDAAGTAASGSADGTQAPTPPVRPRDDEAPRDPAPPAQPPASGDTDDAAVAAIPAPFHGEWNADLSDCGTGNDESRLRISADRIRFYESVGAVEEVDVESDRTITVTAVYQGEGDTWRNERRLSLSADGSSLTVSNGGDFVRHRCP